jgi:uncharacterized membrane protein (UPF0127 family)
MVVATRGVRIAADAWVAKTFWQRLRGLMFRASMREGEAVIFYGAASIHMFFMHFPIDVIYADTDLRVCKVVRGLRPWRVSGCLGACVTIECRCGSVPVGLTSGDRLTITEE